MNGRTPASHHALEAVDASLAFARAQGNAQRRWPDPGRGDDDRILPLAGPAIRPTFRIGPQDTVYAIGSCFARNIERALALAGQPVLSRGIDLGPVGRGLDDPDNFFNKYSIHSVLQDIRWALDRDSHPGADLIYPLGPGRYVDAQLGMARLDHPLPAILDFRTRYLDALAAVAVADVIVLTLGYVETWFDRKLGLWLNVMPPATLVKAEPERFEFRVLSHADVLAALEELHALLSRHRAKPLKMLVTVSPVPLLSTFRDMDVLVANAYSKSVQRAALEAFVAAHPGVDYFPSYEAVTLSDPAIAWTQGDLRHVNPALVQRIMDTVLQAYLHAGPAPAPAAPLPGPVDPDAKAEVAAVPEAASRGDEVARLRALLKAQDFDAVIAATDGAPEDVDLLLLRAQALRQSDRLTEAFAVLGLAQALAPARPEPLERLILLCRPLRQKDHARRLAADHAERFPERAEFRDRLGWL